MNNLHVIKKRIFYLFMILFISLGVVGVTLAAAGHMGGSSGDMLSPYPQVDGQPAGSSHPSPVQYSALPDEVNSLVDRLGEQMRQQAMAGSRVQSPYIESPSSRFAPDNVSGQVSVAQASSGIAGGYIPEKIVIDTYLGRIYGYVTPNAMVEIARNSDQAYGSAEADDTGFFWTPLFDGAGGGFPVDLLPGDELTFAVDGNPTNVTVGPEPQGLVDVTDDLIIGNLPDSPDVTIEVSFGAYGQSSSAYGFITITTDINGDFITSGFFDIGPEIFTLIDYELSGEVVQRTAFFPEEVFLIQQHGMIFGYAPRYNNVHATVFVGDSDEVRWEGDAWADYPFGWFTFTEVLLDIGDKVVLDFPNGSTEMHYIYASYFTFSGDDTVSGNISLADQELRLSFLEWDGFAYVYHETHATSDGSGNFTATFLEGGIRPDTGVDVAIMDPSGAGSYMISGQPYIETFIEPNTGLNCVWGRVDKPNADIFLELERDGFIYPRDPSRPVISDPGNLITRVGACLAVWYDFGNGLEMMTFQPGDILRLSTDTWSGEVTVQEIQWAADALQNQINGEIVSGPLDGEVALRISQPFDGFFPLLTGAEARGMLVDGNYSVPFDNFDVRAGIRLETYFYDPATGYGQGVGERNHFFRTIDDIAVWGHTYIQDEEIQLRLLDPGTLDPVYTSTNDIDSDPFSFYFDFADYPQSPPLQPGIIVEVAYQYSGDEDLWLIYNPVTVDGDVEADKVYGSGYAGLVDLWGGFEQTSFDQMAPTYEAEAILDTAFFGYDLGWGDSIGMLYQNSYGNKQVASNMMGEIRRVEFWFAPDGSTAQIWGTAQSSKLVTIQTSRGDTLYGMPDIRNDGNFDADHSTVLLPGDLVTVTAGAGLFPVVIEIPAISVDSDSTTDEVLGNIGLPGWQVEIYPWWGEDMTTVLTDQDGNFSQAFLDVPPQGRGYIRFVEEVGVAFVDAVFHKPFYDLQPAIRANYNNDWVEGNYDPGHQVWITVTNSLGEVKGTAQVETFDPGWNGDTGFATWYGMPWDGAQPDLQVDDYVYLTIDNGRSAMVQLGEINGVLDVDADTLEGSLNIPWLTDPVHVDCGVWVQDGPGMGIDDVDPQGGTFTCDFSGMWDILPGMDVGVSYNDPEMNQVINVFQEPAPDLRVNMWGQGMPASGNNYVFEIHYNNDGWASAPGVTIQSAYWGMVYLSDTSGFSHTGTGDPADPIIWDVGALPYSHNTERSFYVFVQVTDPPGSTVFTSADIDSSIAYYQGDESRKHTTWESGIAEENDSEVNIGKWSWTWAPAPGQEFVYVLNACNSGSTSSSDVLITDTLPLSTTLVSWWGQEPGWQAVLEDSHELVVTRPTLGDNRCVAVFVNVLLSDQAYIGMNLHNEAWIWADSDIDPGNNFVSFDHPVDNPIFNLHLSPNWVSNRFVPGGSINFEINYENWGNMPIPGTVLTATIPAGTEFQFAYGWDYSSWYIFTPTIVTDEYLVWDIGNIPNGYYHGLGVQFYIDPSTPPGTPLEVEFRIEGDALEHRYDDNVLVYQDTVNENGANLRVDKHTNWGWNSWDNYTRQLWYELRILNIGTEYLENVLITDTYPISTTVSSCSWGHGPGDLQPCEVDETNHQVIFHLDYMNPGDTASANLQVDLAEEYVGVQGLLFTNMVDISDYEDVNPSDNHDEIMSYSGPDVFVRKWLKAGELRPGELITYTVEFGNQNRWSWPWDWAYGSHITETLPEGTTFVKAIAYWDPASPWEPESINGQQVVWNWGTIWADSTWTFDVVVQLDQDLSPGTELLNSIEVWGDGPDEVDSNPANNSFEYLLISNLYRLLLPFTTK